MWVATWVSELTVWKAGIQVDYMGDMDGAAMTRCGQVRNSVMDTGVAARALRMYNMRILNPVGPVRFQLGGQNTISCKFYNVKY